MKIIRGLVFFVYCIFAGASIAGVLVGGQQFMPVYLATAAAASFLAGLRLGREIQ